MSALRLIVSVLIAATAFGQDAGFISRLTQVTVPVVVRDKNGNIVKGLTQDDFRLLDRDQPEVISQFSVELASGADPGSGIAGALQKPETPARFVAYVFDDLTGDGTNLKDARDAAERHIDRTLGPEDRAAIFTTSGQQLCDFTADRAIIHQALAAVRPHGRRLLQDDCVPITYYVADQIANRDDLETLNTFAAMMQICQGSSAGVVDMDQAVNFVRSAASRMLAAGDDQSSVTIHSLREVIRRLSGTSGEHSLVLVSPGFFITDPFRPLEYDLIDQAVRAEVRIGAVNSEGLNVAGGYDLSTKVPGQIARASADYARRSALATEATLAELARGTGGRFFHNSNDLAAGLDQAAARAELVYLLAFSPADLKADGQYHELKVSLNSSVPRAAEYTIDARRGYYAPGNKGGDPLSQVKSAMHSALYSRLEQQQIPLTIDTQMTRAASGKSRVGVTAKIDVRGLDFTKSEGLNSNSLIIVAGVFDPAGKLVDLVQRGFNMKLSDQTLASAVTSGVEVNAGFDLKRGKYLVRFIVSDVEGQQMTMRNLPVNVP